MRRRASFTSADYDLHVQRLDKYIAVYEEPYSIRKSATTDIEGLLDMLLQDIKNTRKETLQICNLAKYYTTLYPTLMEQTVDLQKRCKKLEGENRALSDRVTTSARENLSQENKIEMLENELRDCEMQLSLTSRDMSKLIKEKSELERRATQANDTRRTVVKEKKPKKTKGQPNVAALQEELEMYKEEMVRLQTEVVTLNDQLQDQERITTSESKLNEQLKQACEKMKVKTQEQEKEIVRLQDEVSSKAMQCAKWQKEAQMQKQVQNSMTRTNELRRRREMVLDMEFMDEEEKESQSDSQKEIQSQTMEEVFQDDSASSCSDNELIPPKPVFFLVSPRGNNPMFTKNDDDQSDLTIESLKGIDIFGDTKKGGNMWLDYEPEADLYIEELKPIDIFPIRRKLLKSREGSTNIAPPLKHFDIEVEEDITFLPSTSGQ